MTDEPLSAYVRRTQGQIDGRGPDWLADRIEELEPAAPSPVTTPLNDPIVQACIDNGGHFWPEDAADDEPPTCTRCWFNPGWKAGKPRNEANIRPVRDDPRAD